MQLMKARAVHALAVGNDEFIQRQIGGGDAWFAIAPTFSALFGLYRRDDRSLEAWFRISRSDYVAPKLLPLVRKMRTMLRTERSRVMPTYCSVRPGNDAGERLVRLLGFVPTGDYFEAPGTPVDGVQFWRFEPMRCEGWAIS